MSYVKRRIKVRIKLGKGDFGEGGFDTITLEGLRVSAQITKMGDPGLNGAQIRIYGMALDLMNRLTSLGRPIPLYERNNVVTLFAGDEGATLPQVYVGTMRDAWSAFDGMPEVAFIIDSHTGLLEAVKPVDPSSYPGAADAVVIMQSLAKLMGKEFENSNVPATMLASPYFPGTAMMQAAACAQAANISWMVDDNKLAIWPSMGQRKGPTVEVSAKTGMVMYPSYTDAGIHIRTEYNPSIIFGGTIELKTSVKPANGVWVVKSLSHELESETPNGAWFTTVEGYRLGDSPTVPK